MTTRFDGWAELLAAHLQARESTPFAWGSNDCVTFASDAVLATTGTDPLASLRGQWTTSLGAARVLAGYGGLEAAARALLGTPIDNPAFAQRGDLALVSRPTDAEQAADSEVDGVNPDPSCQTLMAVIEIGRWVAPGDAGLVRGMMSDVLLVWPIGRGV